MGKVIETIERDGETIRVYDDGMEYSVDRGRIVKPPTAYQITPEKSREMLQIRKSKKQDAFMRGFIRGTPGASTDEEAWAMAGETTAKLIHAAKSIRGFSEALNAAAKYSGMDEEIHAHANDGDTPARVLDVAARALAMLDRALTSQRDTIKGQVIDADSD